MQAEPSGSRPPAKNPFLILISVAGLATTLCIILVGRSWPASGADDWLPILSTVAAVLWALIFWWLLHGLAFQLAALVTAPTVASSGSTDLPIVILYMTCDDFLPESCLSCLEQDYPATRFRVLICDDSRDAAHLAQIDRFVEGRDTATDLRLSIVRRPSRDGYKAGNLNNAIRNGLLSGEEWILIIDADQTLPRNYLSALAPILAEQPQGVGFVQAGHVSHHAPPPAASSPPAGPGTPDAKPTRIQEVLAFDVQVFYGRDLPLREKAGFMPFLGHGAAIRRTAWQEVGSFPEVVSEDYAFAMALSQHGYRGVYAESVRSAESFPKDFDSFHVRLRKFAGGTAELFRYEVLRFLLGRSSIVEKYDLFMQLSWFPLSGVMVLNGFLSAYVNHRLHVMQSSPLQPILPYVFTFMFVSPIAVILTVAPDLFAALRYWFWAVAVYTSGLPIAAWHFLAHLGHRPTFVRTPKGDDRPVISPWSRVGLMTLGAAAVACSLRWWSPFSPVLAAQGVAYMGSPLFSWLNEASLIGTVARVVVWVPGTLMLLSLYTMWAWGTF